mgnify:CR=1 FL=1
MPHLLGHFPLTLTMCLRALALHHIVSSSPCGGAGSKKKGGSALVSAKGGGGGGIEPSALVCAFGPAPCSAPPPRCCRRTMSRR